MTTHVITLTFHATNAWDFESAMNAARDAASRAQASLLVRDDDDNITGAGVGISTQGVSVKRKASR